MLGFYLFGFCLVWLKDTFLLFYPALLYLANVSDTFSSGNSYTMTCFDAVCLLWYKVPKGQPETPLGKMHKVTLVAAILNEFKCLRLLQLQSLLHTCQAFAECLGTPRVQRAACVTPSDCTPQLLPFLWKAARNFVSPFLIVGSGHWKFWGAEKGEGLGITG